MTGKWLAAPALALMLASPGAAAPVEQALKTVEATNRADATSQNRIDELSAEALEMLNKYRRAVTRRQQLKVYNQELEKIVGKQGQRKAALQQQIESIAELRAEIEPLMLRMIDHLEQFVAADLPFLLDKRKQRVAALREAVANPELTVAERFRRVLAAYQAEAEYGRTIGTYRGELEIDGQQRFVEFLRVGRVMLFYITPNNDRIGYWDREQEAWLTLPSRYTKAIREGIRVAKDLVAPELIAIPVSAPEHANAKARTPAPGATDDAATGTPATTDGGDGGEDS